jgi:hypothetical protein
MGQQRTKAGWPAEPLREDELPQGWDLMGRGLMSHAAAPVGSIPRILLLLDLIRPNFRIPLGELSSAKPKGWWQVSLGQARRIFRLRCLRRPLLGSKRSGWGPPSASSPGAYPLGAFSASRGAQ